MSEPIPCPTSEKLRAMLRGSVVGGEKDAISEHLEICGRCRTLLDVIKVDEAEQQAVTEIEDPEAAGSLLNSNSPAATMGAAVTTEEEETDPLDDYLKRICQPPLNADAFGIIGAYELISRLGRGGMGAVYKARDWRLGRMVALKFLNPELVGDVTFVERFLREARTAASVNHPNVVTVHSVEEIGNMPYLVMEYVEGESLYKRVQEQGALTVDQVAKIGIQIASGLQAAHDRTVVHRDIKPENILLVAGTDQAKITDFGLAQAEGEMRLTRTGMLLGTPKYMAPEQARGEAVDHRADLFSFGSVLYVMATGQAPFPKLPPTQLLTSVAFARVIPIETVNPALPGWLVEIIQALHQRSPSDRIQSAKEVARLLKRQAALSPPAGPTVVTSRSKSRSKKPSSDAAVKKERRSGDGRRDKSSGNAKKWFIGLLLGAIALLSIGGFLWNKRLQEPTNNPDSQAANNTETPDSTNTVPEPPIEGPFVVSTSTTTQRFADLREALSQSVPGSTITIDADGELEIPAQVVRQPIRIVAAPGKRPVLVQPIADHLEGTRPIFLIESRVLLEGLEFRLDSASADGRTSDGTMLPMERIIRVQQGELTAVHCRFRAKPGHRRQIAIETDQCRLLSLQFCEFIAGRAVDWRPTLQSHLRFDGCYVVAHENLTIHMQPLDPPPVLEIRHSTFIGDSNIGLIPGGRSDAVGPVVPALVGRRTHARIDNSAFVAASALMTIHEPKDMPRSPLKDLRKPPLERFFTWSGGGNGYSVGDCFVALVRDGTSTVIEKTLDDWTNLWRDREASPTSIRLLRDNKPTTFLPSLLDSNSISNVKLSLGRADGGSGQFLSGARLDQVGPGDAYDRWANSESAARLRRDWEQALQP